MRLVQLLPYFFIWFLCNPTWARIQVNKNFKFGSGDLRKVGHFSFLCPNELSPFKQTAILDKAPSKGVYLGLGTERSFFALGIAAYKFEYVILADHDPAVIYFNEINLALIEAAKTLDDYIALRFAKNSLEFQLNLKKLNYLPSGVIDLRIAAHSNWFIRQMHLYRKEFLDACLSGRLGNVYFQSEEHYNSLREMVLKRKIVTRYFELNSAKPFKLIEQELEKADLKLSVLDLSNAWWNRYIKKNDRKFLLGPKQFHHDGIVLVTDKEIDHDISKNREFSLNWIYYGFLRRQLLQLTEEDTHRSLEKLFSCEGGLLSYFPYGNRLIDLDFWQPEPDSAQFLDQPVKDQEDDEQTKNHCCYWGLLRFC